MLLRDNFEILALLLWTAIISNVLVVAIPVFIQRRDDSSIQKGLDYVRAIGIPYLCDALLALKIPDVSGVAESPIGKFGYTIAKIKLSDVSIPKSNLTVSQVKGLTISATNATLSINAHWKYRQLGWPYISDSGSCDLGMKKILLSITLNIDTVEETKPQIRTSDAVLKIGKMKVRFHGGASWLYNVFADSITTDVKGTFERLVVTEMVSLINKEGDKYLALFPGVIKDIKMHLREQQQDEVQDKET
eukprot:Seg143.9 transcript_id=Seg143.9/GoldUCD/mRNA.D3Y31 product="Lipopolysaccharide-binding protein" protein_id=Seg143.9/GoldUCD/D3Y31